MKLRELFRKKETGTDDIPEKIHKRLHIIYFFLKCVIGVFVFLLFYNRLCILLLDVPDFDSEEAPFLWHEYCGTFYVEVNMDNSFASREDYEAYISNTSTTYATSFDYDVIAAVVLCAALAAAVMLIMKKYPRFMGRRSAALVLIYGCCYLTAPNLLQSASIFCYLLLFLALRSGDKKTVFCRKASELFLVSGAVWLVSTVVQEVIVFLSTKTRYETLTGVFSRPSYYFQMYDLFGIPLVILCGGFMLRRRELDISGGDTGRNSLALRCTGCAILAGTAGFVLWRLPVRIYEVIRVFSGGGYTVKLPFTVMDIPYNRLIELPPELADSPQIYRKAVLFRFVKDFPVFILASIAVWFFVKVLFAVSKGELNTKLNRKRLNISMILLAAASLWFNIMGIPELDIFNEGFTGIYGEVVYTMALRSKTEPMLYALVLWFFKTYLQAIPETEAPAQPAGGQRYFHQ